MIERRQRDRGVGESKLTIPEVRSSIFFFKGMDGHWTPMVKARDYRTTRFPRAAKVGIITR